MSFAEAHLDQPFARGQAEAASVPVAIHLDHGTKLETVSRAIACGFSSVMIDGSTLSLDDNIALTKETVAKAHAVGVSVEAELGHVGGGEGNTHGAEACGSRSTVPEEAFRFMRETEIDATAVAIGSAELGL